MYNYKATCLFTDIETMMDEIDSMREENNIIYNIYIVHTRIRKVFKYYINTNKIDSDATVKTNKQTNTVKKDQNSSITKNTTFLKNTNLFRNIDK